MATFFLNIFLWMITTLAKRKQRLKTDTGDIIAHAMTQGFHSNKPFLKS
jgi:hypothetical protein